MMSKANNDGFFKQADNDVDETDNTGYDFEFVDCDDYQCMICLKIIRMFVELPCGHAGCNGCIQQWETQNSK